MNFDFTSEQLALRDAVRGVLSTEAAPARLRALWESPTGRDPAAWQRLAELGVPGVLVADEFDGGGGDEFDLYLVLEEAGRAALPDALLESCLLAPYLISAHGSVEFKDRWLPGLAAGTLRAAVALGGTRVVADAHVSDLLLLEDDGRLLALTREEVALEPLVSMDPSRRLFAVSSAPGAGVEVGGAEVLAAAHARRMAGSAAVLIGIATRLIELTVDYAKVRFQFGRPIGSFQGVKHQLAQAVSLNALARQAAVAAVYKLAHRSPDAADAAVLARVCAVEAESESNHVALQVHGGVGFTWEHDLQLWLKLGKSLEQAHGGRRDTAALAGRLGRDAARARAV
jgi:alkylation response protein AidB-like acyl-CoA dehydrogenase